MSLLRSLAALLVAASSVFAVVGCAPPGVGTNVEDTTESEDAAVAFEVLDVRLDDAPAGFTVITSKAAYVAHFGAEPPEGVSFKKHWVLHHSLGVMPTGGYATEIGSIEKAGTGDQRTIVVTTVDTEPGPGCNVTQALTNPQVVVRINKHNGATVKHASEIARTDCGDHDFCPLVRCAKGFVCDEAQNACVPGPCDPENPDECGVGQACQNLIRCITAPCPEDYRCHPVSEDPCQGLDYGGSCDGQTVRWCEEQAIQTLDCGADGECFEDADGFADCR